MQVGILFRKYSKKMMHVGSLIAGIVILVMVQISNTIPKGIK